MNVKQGDSADLNNSNVKFEDVWMDWNATAAVVAYKLPDDPNSHMCLVRRQRQLTESSQSSSVFPGRVEPISVINCSRVIWSQDNSWLVYVCEKPASENINMQQVAVTSSQPNGLFFMEVGNSVAKPKLIIKEAGVSHVVHSLQMGPIVLVLQKPTEWSHPFRPQCTLPDNTVAKLCGYLLKKQRRRTVAPMCLKVILQFYSFIPQRLLHKQDSSSLLLVGFESKQSQALQFFPLSLEKQFNRLQGKKGQIDTKLKGINEGPLSTLNWDSERNGICSVNASYFIEQYIHAPYLMLLHSDFKGTSYVNRLRQARAQLDNNLERINGGRLTTLNWDMETSGFVLADVSNYIGMVIQHPIANVVFAGLKEHEWALLIYIYNGKLRKSTYEDSFKLKILSAKVTKAKAILMLDIKNKAPNDQLKAPRKKLLSGGELKTIPEELSSDNNLELTIVHNTEAPRVQPPIVDDTETTRGLLLPDEIDVGELQPERPLICQCCSLM